VTGVSPKAPTRLSERQEQFCRAYVTHFNGSKAALQAGYSKATAPISAVELRRMPQIQERIRQLLKPREVEYEATRERTLQELCRIAYFDPRELYDDNGHLKPIKDLDAHVAAAISVIEEESRTEGRDESTTEIRLKKVRLHDKMKALEMLSKHLQLYSDAAQVQVNAQINIGDLSNLDQGERDLMRQLLESRASKLLEHQA
jgi:phage terminase small subunit